MQRVLPWIAIALGAVAIALAWLIQTSIPARIQGALLMRPPVVHAVDVVAHTQDDETCAVDSLSPMSVDARPGDFLVWNVDNQCKTDLLLTRFERLQPTPGPTDPNGPLDNHPPTTDRRVPAGQHAKIRTKVRPNADEGLYRYWIETNDRSGWFSVCDEPPCPWDP